MPSDPRHLVSSRTRLQSPPVVPELRLHLGEDMERAWQSLQDELDDGDLDPPFWAFAWLGGQALARYVLDAPDEVAGKRVLDVAAGSGICGLAAARAGARSVRCTDVDPLAVTAIELNASENDLRVDVTTADVLDAGVPDVDVVLAGDVFYEQPMSERMLGWLTTAQQAGVRVLVGDPGRHYVPRSRLQELAGYDVPTTRELEGVELKRVRVYALQ